MQNLRNTFYIILQYPICETMILECNKKCKEDQNLGVSVCVSFVIIQSLALGG